MKLSKTENVYNDLNGAALPSVTTTNTYDDYGNPITVVVSGSGGDTKTTTNTVTNNTTDWILGSITETQTAHALVGLPTITRQASFQYDATTGQMIREVIEPNVPADRLTTDYQKDEFGNDALVTVSGIGIDDRITAYSYDYTGRYRTAIKRYVNNTGTSHLTERFAYDDWFGQVVRAVDVDGALSASLYDGFGRIIEEIDYWKISYAYCSGVAGGSVACSDDYDVDHGALRVLSVPIQARTYVQSGPAEVEIMDGQRRQIAVGVEEEVGPGWSLTVTSFDSRGDVQMVTLPYQNSGSATEFSTFTYDVLGRVTSRTMFPSGRVDELSYNGNVTTYTEDTLGLKQSTITELNDQGLVIKVTEPNSLITQSTYNAVGELLEQMDSAGNKVTNKMDTRGRVITRIDSSSGTSIYVYNVMDELIQETDANGQTLTHTYDRVGRRTGTLRSTRSRPARK